MPESAERRRVIFVEYHDGRPHEVIARTRHRGHDGKPYHVIEYYDFDWCKRDECLYYHESGSGGDAEFTLYPCTAPYQVWAAPGVSLIRKDKMDGYHPATILDEPLFGWPNDRLFDMAEESETEHCPTCGDDLPSEDTDELCDHVWWCDSAGWWSKPGERCQDDCEDCRERDRETRGDEHPLGKQAKGFGLIAEGPPDGHWMWSSLLLSDDPRRWVIGGYGAAATAFFDESPDGKAVGA